VSYSKTDDVTNANGERAIKFKLRALEGPEGATHNSACLTQALPDTFHYNTSYRFLALSLPISVGQDEISDMIFFVPKPNSPTTAEDTHLKGPAILLDGLNEADVLLVVDTRIRLSQSAMSQFSSREDDTSVQCLIGLQERDGSFTDLEVTGTFEPKTICAEMLDEEGSSVGFSILELRGVRGPEDASGIDLLPFEVDLAVFKMSIAQT